MTEQARSVNTLTVDELIARTVDGAPEPTPEQIEAIAAALSPQVQAAQPARRTS
jgi:hypothetical protein